MTANWPVTIHSEVSFKKTIKPANFNQLGTASDDPQ